MPKTILTVARERHIARLIVVNLQRIGYRALQLNLDEATPERIDEENPDCLILPVGLLPSIRWARRDELSIGEYRFQLWQKFEDPKQELNLRFLK